MPPSLPFRLSSPPAPPAPARLLALTCAILLGACASPPPPPPSDPEPVPVAVAPAEELSSRTRADELLALAATADREASAAYLLEAAELLRQEGEVEEASEIADFIRLEGLSPALTRSVLLLRADLAAASEQPAQVLAILRSGDFANSDQLSPDQRIHFRTLQAQALTESGAILQGALELIELDRLLAPAARANNHEQIWQALASLSTDQLQALSTEAPNADAQGWYQLVLLGKAYADDLDRQLIELRRWRETWPDHPAAALPPREMALAETMANERPQQVALLLPLGTPAGIVVRDAFMSAYYNLQALGGQVPNVLFYDTGNANDVRELHRRARAEGAQMIIGPLLKQQVATLQAEADLGVPTLALNNLEGAQPASPLLFQFALSPESEAQQLANKAWRDGHRRAAVLSPLDDAGNDFYARKRDSFVQEWERLGGRVVALDIYRENYTDTISDMLELSASQARMERLREIIRRPVVFAPRRRQDIDFIYLVAQPGPARQIVPSLAYLYAGDIPVYASQDVYSGVPRPVEDRDLDGVVFGDSPWLLGNSRLAAGRTRELFPMNSAQNLRLQAFGMDAFRLYPRLRLLQSSAESRIPGLSGVLRLGPNQNIERELSWATIVDGLVQAQTQQ